MGLNPLDIIILVIVGINIGVSAWRGLVREIFGLLAIILGIVIASHTYLGVGIQLNKFLSNSNLANIIGFIVVFLLAAVLLSLVGQILSKVIKILLLGWINSLGGAIFGFIKGGLIVGIILIILSRYPVGPFREWINSSSLAGFFFNFIRIIIGLLPKDFSGIIEQFLTRTKGKIV